MESNMVYFVIPAWYYMMNAVISRENKVYKNEFKD